MLNFTEMNGIPLNPTITDKLALMAYNVLRTYCHEHEGYESRNCEGCVFFLNDEECPWFSEIPSFWPDLEVENEKRM